MTTVLLSIVACALLFAAYGLLNRGREPSDGCGCGGGGGPCERERGVEMPIRERKR
jgi:hypothetical protein